MLVQITGLTGGASAMRRPPLVEQPTTEIHVRTATIRDMRQVEPLIALFAQRSLMLPKSHDQLARLFREFVVAVDGEGTVVGCGALRVYTESLAEIASLAVAEHAHGRGIGRRIVDRLVQDAGGLGIGTVFALTLQEEFFHRSGFRTVPREMFPLKVWADCRTCPKLHACDEIAVAREVRSDDRTGHGASNESAP